MRTEYTDIVKDYFSKELKNERKRLGLTQLELAVRLEMDGRSYVDLEHGKSPLGGLSLLLFLLRAESDTEKVLNDIRLKFAAADSKKKGRKK